jgi:hypothetical protein
MPLGTQVAWLFVLAIPVASIAWTVTHEDLFHEAREFCVRSSERCRHWYQRKFFYLFTCEYCFSHYVSALFLAVTGYTLLLPGWRGFLVAWLALVWIANQYMGVFNRLRLGIKDERINIQVKEEQLDNRSAESA